MKPHSPYEKIIFDAVVRLPVAERVAYLEKACAGNPELRSTVEALLKAHEEGGSSLITKTAGIDDGETLPAGEIHAGVSARHGPTTEQPGDMIGHYKLLQQIGEGGFGVVYMAEQEEPVRRRVALKVIKLGMDTKEVVARFEAERQALAMMEHPNIAQVFDGGTTATGRPFFVMELVKGIPIIKFCNEQKLETKERLDLFIDVCSAIQHAHQKGVIHRDIKPSNILVTLHGDKPVPKVIDFGIAKATQQPLTDKTLFTQFQQFIGTPAYMSPEQASLSALDIDTRSDIYSLGVLLYELLTGKTPFDAKSLVSAGLEEMRRIIREQEPAKPSTRLSTLEGEERLVVEKQHRIDSGKLSGLLRGDLDWIVMKALEKDRTRRYETANSFAQDIQRHLNNEPVTAAAPSATYRFQKMVRRNKLVFTAASVVAVSLIVGISVSTWSFLQERDARRRASTAEKIESEQRRRAEQGEAEAQHLLYVANMNLAQQAWERNNVDWLQQLLRETQDSPDRGFEWYYWQRQAHWAVKTFRGHEERVTGEFFNPSERRIATGGDDGGRKIINVYSQSAMGTMPGGISSVAFSPNSQRIVTGSYDKTAKVWDVTSGRELLTLKGHRNIITSVAFSSDGQQILSGSADGTVKVWAAASGREIRTLKGHGKAITSVAFSLDSQRIVTSSDDKTARVWDAVSGTNLFTFERHSEKVKSVAFSPDGQRIVSGSADKTAMVWDVVTGTILRKLERHSDAVESVAFSRDGQRIVTGSADKTAMVWDAVSGTILRTFNGHSNAITSVAFSPDGQRIVSGSADKTARVWETASGRELLKLEGHSGSIRSVAFSPDGQRIVTGSEDITAKAWYVASGREQLTLKGNTKSISSVAFSPDGQLIVTGSGDKTAKLWETISGRELFTFSGHSNAITSVAFSPDGQRMVTGGGDFRAGTAKVWKVASRQELLTFKGQGKITSVAFSSDGQHLVTGSEDGTAKVWDAASGRELLTTTNIVITSPSADSSPDNLRLAPQGPTNLRLSAEVPINSVAFSPDGHRIVTGTGDGIAKVWNVASDRVMLTLRGHSKAITSVAYSPDGRRIVTSSDDQTAKIWNAESGNELLTLKGHSGFIKSVAFSPDGRRIVTGSLDQTAKVWDVTTGRELLTLKGHSAAILAVAISLDGRRIVTGSDDLTARVWEAASPEQVAAWDSEIAAAPKPQP